MKRFLKLYLALAFVIGSLVFTLFAPVSVQAAGTKRIVVVLSQQKLYAYQGNTLVASMAVNARGTARGTFRVQNKIPMASSVVRGWRLSYWMGIYYVRGVQNGIHGPEFIGNRTAAVSLGCVVIRNLSNAAWLYRWATVGTTVTIR
ncbi:MAG TPA: L,D-transpeptidase [Anaerolineae bacterium]|jgi:lipoprotein-anchoring transpeptidase ErfK/SrfK